MKLFRRGKKPGASLLAPRLVGPGGGDDASVQAGALILMAVPALVLLVFQRFFMQDMAVTRMEK